MRNYFENYNERFFFIVHTIQREYESENENSKRQKKMAQQSGRKSNGIGPTTKEGIPTVLRSVSKPLHYDNYIHFF